MLAGHVLAVLVAKGAVDSDGIKRTARLVKCFQCSQAVIIGLDGDVAGLPAAADPLALEPNQEYEAMLAKRRTYQLSGPLERLHLDIRLPMHVGGKERYSIVAEHVCERDS